MKLALEQSKKAALIDDVPVGCVIVKDGKVISKAYNIRHNKNISTAHAEILAINKACKKLNSWRLDDCEIYVTLEPCPMCAGAILQSRIKKVYFAAYDKKSGSFGGCFNLNDVKGLNHYVEIESGILQSKCSEIIKTFFKSKRK